MLPFVSGGLLIGCFTGLALLSSHFAHARDLAACPIPGLVILLISAGAVYLLHAWRLMRSPRAAGPLHWVLLVGILMRVSMFFSNPILEDDAYRYLWDGGVAAHGINPYRYAPAQALNLAPGADPMAQSLHDLAVASDPVAHRVNHPELRTLYPPAAQLAFAFAHVLSPWSMAGWRLVLFLFDALTALLLVVLLKELRLPRAWLSLYWWSPLVVKEIYNSGHMDVLAMPFVLGALACAIRRRHLAAVVLLALGVGTKLWPVVLAPVLLRPLFSTPRRLAVAAGLLAVISLALAGPLLLAVRGPDSGLLAYAQRWEMNDAVFMLIVWSAEDALNAISTDLLTAQELARFTTVVLLGLAILAFCRRPITDPADMCRRCLWVVFALLTLSPTQFPWYYTWLLPFLALQPRLSLLLLTALLPLYYARFYFEGRHAEKLFDYGIVWLQFVPAWYLLLVEGRIGRLRFRAQ